MLLALNAIPFVSRQVTVYAFFVRSTTESRRRIVTTTTKKNQWNHPKSNSIVSAAVRYRLTTIPETPKTTSLYRLVIVESPSKCKTISKILDQYVQDHSLNYTYVVTSCMGHLRNLPTSKPKEKQQPKEKLQQQLQQQTILGIDIQNNYTPTYVILPGKELLVKDLQTLASTAEQIVIATDDDREGEAIGWHLQELLPSTVPSVRVTFGEITKSAIYTSMDHPRTLNMDLVQAQETRRILDRLAGYTVSPILWKKIAPGLSAGRVQSVGMAMIVQRERERLRHVAVEYWDLQLVLDDTITANLQTVSGKPIALGSDFDNTGNLVSTNKIHMNAAEAHDVVKAMTHGTYTISKIASKERRQSPPLPFTTSTLQQEGNKRLGMSVSQIMSTAQQLYENGFISYMRTDSNQLSQDAQQAVVKSIQQKFGSDMVGDGPRLTTKPKNAQEAHEAIRPAIQEDGFFLDPENIPVSDSQLSLYKFIWQRTVASRMINQVINSTSVDILGLSDDNTTELNFRVSGSIVIEPGYTLAWDKSSTDVILPNWEEGQHLNGQDLVASSHNTQPLARYNEASFVKALEELGVGRPSTYAGVVQLLRDRAYIGSPIKADSYASRRQKAPTGSAIIAQRAAGGEDFVGGGRGPMVPSLSAFVVCSLLENHCPSYVDPSFTATMEERLDEIARGQEGAEKVKYLDEYYAGENGLAARVLAIEQSVDSNEARRANLPGLSSNVESGGNDIGLFIGPWGPYVQNLSKDLADGEKPPTAALPAGMAADLSTISISSLEALLIARENDGFLLGTHPDDDREIRLKVGRYGAFLQWGSSGEEGTTTHSLPKNLSNVKNLDLDLTADKDLSLGSMIGLTLEEAIGYVSLPRIVCTYNELPILAAIGPYGPYLKYNNAFASLTKASGDVLTINEEDAVQVVIDGIINKSSKLARGVLAELGEKNGSMVTIKDGLFGKYISWKKVNAKIPLEYLENPSELPLEDAWALLDEKGAGSVMDMKGKKSKTTTDSWNLPLAPKRPKSAYLHFCAEIRSDVKKTFTTLGDVSKEMARLWAATENVTGARQQFDALAAEEKTVYEKQREQWTIECQKIMSNLPSSSTRKISVSDAKKGSSRVNREKDLKSKSTSPEKPKKGLSSYLFFCAEKRPEVSQNVKRLGDISKELARLWSETNDRSKYEELAAADALRYEEAMANFHANGSISVPVSKDTKKIPVVVTANTLKTKKIPVAITSIAKAEKIPLASTNKNVAQPSKRAPSAYMLFCSEYRKTIVDASGAPLPFGNTTRRLAELWKDCDPAIRANFDAQAAEAKKQQHLLNT